MSGADRPGRGVVLHRAAVLLVALLLSAGTAGSLAAQELVPPDTALARASGALQAGDLGAARTAYLDAAAGLSGSEATRALSVAMLLGRVSPDGGTTLSAALAELRQGRAEEAVRVLTDSAAVPPADRPALLAFAAELADEHGLTREAELARRRLVRDHARSAEAPAALLDLARSLLRDGTPARGEAKRLLERLILEYPTSALVPQARRELRLLPSGDAGSEGG